MDRRAPPLAELAAKLPAPSPAGNGFPAAFFRYIFPAPMPTFYDQFVEAEQHGQQNIALEIQRKDQVESYTYAETRKMSESVGRWLTERKLPSGVRVAIF